MKKMANEPEREKEKLQNMMHFSQRFLDTDNVPDIQEITEFMRTLTGAFCAVFNQYEDYGMGFTTKAIAVKTQYLFKAADILGFNPVGKKWSHDPIRKAKIQHEMVTTFENLYSLTGKTLPEQLIRLLETIFDIGQVAIVKTMKKEKAIGDFTLMMPKGTPMESQELAILFATQVGLYLDRVQHEQKLKESEEKHRRLFETMSPGVIYQSVDGTIISANPAAERMIGISLDQMQVKSSIDPRWKMIKKDGSSVLGSEHPAMIALKTGKKTGPVTRGVFIPETDDYVWLSITAIPLFRVGEVKPYQSYSILDDITERKKAEEKLKEYAQELESKNMELDIAVQQAEKANQAKSRYLAHMNHEIRTPLNGFVGFLQLMGITELDKEQQEYMHYMKQSTSHMLDIINNVLDMAKIEAGEILLTNRIFNLAEEIETALAPLHSLASQNNIHLQVTLDKNLPHQVEGDPDRLRQVVLNLGGNAVKFTKKGQVQIAMRCLETAQEKHIIQLLVEDTGAGMTQETVDRIFLPFYQADDGSTPQSKGTGLGMTITKELVELMDGEIQVNSTLGKGTRIEVHLMLGKVATKSHSQ